MTPSVVLAVLASSCVIAFAANRTVHVVKKCCAAEEQFDDAGFCANRTDDDVSAPYDDENEWWWFDSVAAPNLTRDAEYRVGAWPGCHIGDTQFLVNSFDDSFRQYSLRRRNDSGSLVVQLLETPTFPGHTPSNRTLEFDDFCMDRVTMSYFAVVVCPCKEETCIKKCCWNQQFYNGTSGNCESDLRNLPPWSLEEPTGEAPNYYPMTGNSPTCPEGSVTFLLRSNRKNVLSKKYNYTIDRNGVLKVPIYKTPVQPGAYCGEVVHLEDGTIDYQGLVVCQQVQEYRFGLYGVAHLVGGVLFMLAILCQFALVDFHLVKLHDRILVAQNVCFGVASFTMGIVMLRGAVPEMCHVVGFLIQFSFLAAFFWLNVMCIDISWAFSGIRAPQGSDAQRDRKKFLYYSLYAWGTTAAISAITAAAEFSGKTDDPDPDWLIRPGFGKSSCWFEHHDATLLYFYGPITLLLLSNLVLFVYTAMRLIAWKRETAMARESGSRSGKLDRKERQRLMLYLKLFLLMGLTWITEIISWAIGGDDRVWYLTDFINLLRAVFIFIIFCCKRTVLDLLRAKIHAVFPSCAAPKRQPGDESSTDKTGRDISMSTSLSRKTSTDNNPHPVAMTQISAENAA